MPGNQAESIGLEIRRVIQRVSKNHKLQGRYKRVGIRIRIRPDANTHGLTLREEHPLVIRRHVVDVVLGSINDGPQRAVDDLVENRRRVPAVDSAVVVSRPDHVPSVAVDLHIVAVLPARNVRERPEGGENGDQAGLVEGFGGAGAGEEGGVREPLAAVDLGFDFGAAVDQSGCNM